jgi:hypothetical protein
MAPVEEFGGDEMSTRRGDTRLFEGTAESGLLESRRFVPTTVYDVDVPDVVRVTLPDDDNRDGYSHGVVQAEGFAVR